MSFLKFFLSFFLVFISMVTLAATVVAPANRVRIWDGPYALPDSEYMTGNATDIGIVKTLKYSVATELIFKNINYLKNTGGLDMNLKVLTAIPYNNNLYERLSEVSIPSGECVAFAKAMTGSTGSPTWYKGSSLMNYLSWNGVGYRLNSGYMIPVLQPGTMIAHFQGLPQYPQRQPYGHVAIFLSWSYDSRGYIDGINVVDQNLIWTINGIKGSQGTIQKHKIPLSGSKTTTYNSSSYHVVDVRGSENQYT